MSKEEDLVRMYNGDDEGCVAFCLSGGTRSWYQAFVAAAVLTAVVLSGVNYSCNKDIAHGLKEMNAQQMEFQMELMDNITEIYMLLETINEAVTLPPLLRRRSAPEISSEVQGEEIQAHHSAQKRGVSMPLTIGTAMYEYLIQYERDVTTQNCSELNPPGGSTIGCLIFEQYDTNAEV